MEKSLKSMKPNQRRVHRLKCSVQNYDWGKVGPDSEVARIYASNSGDEIDPKKPYAEFWMGTHDSGPSFLTYKDNNGVAMSLKERISTNSSELLGLKVVQKWGSDLPFLFKAHPDKDLAKMLHHKFMPNAYKNDNHKPEMALAITHFQALCGFITLEEHCLFSGVRFQARKTLAPQSQFLFRLCLGAQVDGHSHSSDADVGALKC